MKKKILLAIGAVSAIGAATGVFAAVKYLKNQKKEEEYPCDGCELCPECEGCACGEADEEPVITEDAEQAADEIHKEEAK